MREKKETLCEYKECYLPENNNKYKVQFGYLLFSGVYLIADKTEFTFFSLLMFTLPIILDLVYNSFPVKLYKKINNFFLIVNIAIGIFCFMGMVGIFVDNGEGFYFSNNSLLLPGKGFTKEYLLFPLAANMTIPIMMYYANPSKSTKWLIKRGREQRKVGST